MWKALRRIWKWIWYDPRGVHFERITVPLIQQSYPLLNNIVNVQPLSQSSVLVYYLRYRYAKMKEIPELEPWQVTVRNVLTGYLRARLNLDYNRKYEVERSSLDITVIEEDARIFAIIAEITFGSNAVMVGIGSNYVEIKYSAPDMFDMVYFHVKQMVALHESVNTHRWSNGN